MKKLLDNSLLYVAIVILTLVGLIFCLYNIDSRFKTITGPPPVEGAEQLSCPTDAAVHPQEVQLSTVWITYKALEGTGCTAIFKTSSSGEVTHAVLIMTGYSYPTLCSYLIDGNLRFLRLDSEATGYEWDTSVELEDYLVVKQLFQDNFNPSPTIKPFHS